MTREIKNEEIKQSKEQGDEKKEEVILPWNGEFTLKIKCGGPAVRYSADYKYIDAIIDGFDYSSEGRSDYMIVGYRADLSMAGKVSVNGLLKITKSEVNIKCDTFYGVYKSTDKELSTRMNNFLEVNRIVLNPHVMKKFGDLHAYAYKVLANTIFAQIRFDEMFPSSELRRCTS
ncbi:uncharacterized protein LOC116161544 [Photinus pyralis]|uniref:uncharacterized protein LOC116161544 n=1 Tax=Photinus pyralis TaxID=7054 RepID=UPI001266E61D|nr:uncharacterized protein LOC116161544 [Photinus pyralis]